MSFLSEELVFFLGELKESKELKELDESHASDASLALGVVGDALQESGSLHESDASEGDWGVSINPIFMRYCCSSCLISRSRS